MTSYRTEPTYSAPAPRRVDGRFLSTLDARAMAARSARVEGGRGLSVRQTGTAGMGDYTLRASRDHAGFVARKVDVRSARLADILEAMR